ncbi:MAG: response regulator transcription factor [Bacteroidetes bacterium]|nr:response regulator transcription factor [Bacteroidota bacterium]
MPAANTTIDIVIADDHPLFRKGLRDVIESEEHLTILGEAGDGDSALQLISRHKPAVAVLDIDMPNMNGLDVSKKVLAGELRTRIVILTMYDDEALFNRAMDIGVTGYVLKDSAVDDIVQGIDVVAGGGYFISPVLSGLVMKKNSSVKSNKEEKIGLMQLTTAEQRILRMIAEEMTTTTIAEELSISPRTVEHHRSNIIGKLGLSGQYALVRFALQHKNVL